MTPESSTFGQILQAVHRQPVPQQALRRHHDQRLAEAAQHLAAQHVEHLCRGGRHHHLHVVLGAQLQDSAPGAPRSAPGPGPRKPCGSNMVSRTSGPTWLPEEMNWSMTTWAPLAKSPNWASQMVSRSTGRRWRSRIRTPAPLPRTACESMTMKFALAGGRDCISGV
jgi:hypothetical protein